MECSPLFQTEDSAYTCDSLSEEKLLPLRPEIGSSAVQSEKHEKHYQHE